MKNKSMTGKEIYVFWVIWVGLGIILVILMNTYIVEPVLEHKGIIEKPTMSLIKYSNLKRTESNLSNNSNFKLGRIYQVTELPKYKYEQNLSVSIHCDIYQGNISFYYGDKFHIDTNCEEVFERR